MHNPRDTLRKLKFQSFWLVIAAILLPVCLVVLITASGPNLEGGPDEKGQFTLLVVFAAVIFGADWVAKLRFWDHLPRLMANNREETTRIVLFAGAFATIDVPDGLTWSSMVLVWAREFVIYVALFAATFTAFGWISARWKARKARKSAK